MAAIGCEPEVAHFMMRVLREGDIAVDAGANVGFFTLLMAKLVGPTGHVLAFEPNRDTSERLLVNAMLNELEHVTVSQTALWDSVRDLPLYVNPIDPGLTSLRAFREVNGSQYVRTTTLDRSISKAKLIKMDVEGAECHVMAGAVRLLGGENRVPFILSELNEPALKRFGKSAHDLRDFMRDAGYSTFLPQPDGTLPILVPPKTRLIGGPQNLNVLFASVEDVSRAYPECEVVQKRS
jgi:FkbM family methyltransferase